MELEKILKNLLQLRRLAGIWEGNKCPAIAPFSTCFKLCLSICFLFFFSFCNLGILPSKKSGSSNALLGLTAYALYVGFGNCDIGGDIWARNVQTQNSYCVPVEIVSTKSKVIVYKQRGLIVNYNLETFASEFNDQIYPRLVSAFGEPSDVDKNGTIKILVLDILDGSQPNAPYVAGFFDPINFYSSTGSNSLRTNFAEILYIDGKELVESLSKDPTAFLSTAAHEFQHLIRFPFMVKANVNDDLWINEGTSEVASDIAGYGPQRYRLDCFRGADSNRCPSGANGVSLLNWSNQTNSSIILKQYALAYSYMRYLYDISGSTDLEKNSFFKKTVQGGNTGVRAATAGQLMTLLRESPKYNASLLGTTDPETFFRTFMLFYGQAAGITNFSSVDRYDVSLSVQNFDISSALSAYPFETTLNDLITNPLKEIASGSSLSLITGSAFAIGSNYPLTNITGSSKYQNMGTVKTAGSTKTLLGWGAYSTVNPLISIRRLGDENVTTARDRYRGLFIEDTSIGGRLPLCGSPFIDESYHSDESILIEQPSLKNGSIP